MPLFEYVDWVTTLVNVNPWICAVTCTILVLMWLTTVHAIASKLFRKCDFKMAAIKLAALFLALFIISLTECGKPSLSDPLGLFEQPEFVGTGKNYVSGSVWPKPQSETRQSTFYALDPEKFMFSSVGQQSSVLSLAVSRYRPITFPDTKVLTETSLGLIETLQIKVLDKYEPLTLSSDESCK